MERYGRNILYNQPKMVKHLMAFSVEYIYQIIDKYSGPLGKITQSTKKFTEAQSLARAKVAALSKKMKDVGDKMASFRNAVGGAAMVAAMWMITKSTSKLDDAMADVGRVTGLTGKELVAMRERLQAIGRATGKSALGLAAIAYEGGKIGIANDKMDSFVSIVMKTAAAFDMVDQEAGRSIGSIRAKLGLTVVTVDTLLQRVNFLADNTSAAGAQMINIIERTSGTMKMLNIPNEVIAGWAAFANQIEVTPELAASGMNMMMRRMMKMPGMMEKMLKDPKMAARKMLQDLTKMPEAKRGVKILKMFGDEAGRFVMKAVSNMELLDKTMNIAASNKALGSMDREFANIMARSSTAALRIKETFIDIGRAIGRHFVRVFDKHKATLIAVSEKMLAFTKAHPGIVKTAIALGAFAAALVAIVIPLGLLVAAVGQLLPIMVSIGAAFGAVSWPVIAIAAGLVYLGFLFAGMYAKSANLRMAIGNLVSAFAPLLTALKTTMVFIGEKMGIEMDRSGESLKVWGDVFANIINGIAAMIKGVFNLIEGLAKAAAALSLGEGFGKAWDELKGTLGYEVAAQEAGKNTNNKMEITGEIGVRGKDGAEVESAEINLDTGANVAMAY